MNSQSPPRGSDADAPRGGVRHASSAPRRLPAVLARNRGGRNPNWAGADQGWTAACTLVAGVVVWGGLGAILDHVLGTWPFLFIIGAVGGNFAGIYLIYVRFFRDAPAPAGLPQGKRYAA